MVIRTLAGFALACVIAAAEPFSCPVTKANQAFVPSEPYPTSSAQGSLFVGTAKLFTLVWPNNWAGTKLVWWSPGNDSDTGTSPGLAVDLTRLDMPSPVLRTGRAHWAHIAGQPPFITTGMDAPPTAGCWEIKGRLNGNEVRYVVWLGSGPRK